MTHRELIRKVAEDSGVEEAAVQKVIKQLADSVIDVLSKGDEVDIRLFGKFYPHEYNAPAGNLGFGGRGQGGVRRSVRFRSMESANRQLTRDWMA